VDRRLQIERVPTIDLARTLGVQTALTFGALERVRSLVLRARPDLIHANSLEFQTSITAAKIRRVTGVPMVLTAHIAGFGSMAEPWRTLGAMHNQTIGRFLLSRADRVIAVSDAVERYLHRLGVPSSKIHVIPNGVDREIFYPEPAREGAEVRVLFVGRLVPNKGCEQAIRAVATLQTSGANVTLTIVGDGPLRPRLQSLTSSLGADVRFIGWSQEVARHLRETDVLVRPTLTEGMSLSVLEAMASGVCVIASDVPGNVELIRHEETGLLVRAGDAWALERSLRRVVADPGERRRLGASAFEASRAYSWERCASQTLEVFLEAARIPHRARGAASRRTRT
jgi:glycosyltransferase involved in cell wall biosynthesis